MTTLFGDSAWNPMLPIRNFFEAIKDRLPNDVTITYPTSGDVIDDVTGAITGTWSDLAQAVTVGTGATVYAAPVGVLVHWLTGSIVDGRRLRAGTYLVPTIAQEGATGQPDAALIADVQAAADTLAALSPGLRAWHRPIPAPTPPATSPPARPGTSRAVTSATVMAKFAVLRSRRD